MWTLDGKDYADAHSAFYDSKSSHAVEETTLREFERTYAEQKYKSGIKDATGKTLVFPNTQYTKMLTKLAQGRFPISSHVQYHKYLKNLGSHQLQAYKAIDEYIQMQGLQTSWREESDSVLNFLHYHNNLKSHKVLERWGTTDLDSFEPPTELTVSDVSKFRQEFQAVEAFSKRLGVGMKVERARLSCTDLVRKQKGVFSKKDKVEIKKWRTKMMTKVSRASHAVLPLKPCHRDQTTYQ